MTIGILPAGYHEGIDRRLSNRGVVKIQNQLCPIIGRVCMNLTIIDLTKVDKPQVGDKVEIYSADKNARSSIFLQAEAAQTIPNKLLTGLDSSLNRKLV